MTTKLLPIVRVEQRRLNWERSWTSHETCSANWKLKPRIIVFNYPTSNEAEFALKDVQEISKHGAGAIIVDGITLRDKQFSDGETRVQDFPGRILNKT